MSQHIEESSHYVARIVVERVDHKLIETYGGVGNSKIREPKRTVTELTALTLKSDELDALVERVGKHLALVEDIESVDPVKPRGTRSSE